MVELSTRTIPLLIARLVLAWVFISAGLPKVQDPLAFSTAIEGYRIIGGTFALWVAIILPWLELVIGIGLLTPWLRRASGCAMVALLGLFIVLHASAWARGLDISCGCFGESTDSPDYHWLIFRNLTLLVITIFTLLPYLRNKKQPESSQ